MKKKELYTAPETDVLELSIENAILDASYNSGDGQLPEWGDGGDI